MRPITACILTVASVALLAASSGCTTGEPAVIDPAPSAEETQAALGHLDSLELSLELFADGLDQPLFAVVSLADDSNVYVLEKAGRVWEFDANGERLSEEPFLDLSSAVSTDVERGLLGLAFAPDYAETGRLYVNYTDLDGDTVVSRFTLEPSATSVDAGTEQPLFQIDQPYPNHNGGMIAFGPDGYLYVGMGDGGLAADPHDNGQRTDTMLGKMLRIDATSPIPDEANYLGPEYMVPPDNPFVDFHPEESAPLPEIWARGLRNPWRFSFDRRTGDMWIGDVGQNSWEEIDFQPASSTGGENYGWRMMEGSHGFPPGTEPDDTSGYVMPFLEYPRSAGKSVTGGYVYRGDRSPEWDGVYIFGDYVSGKVWAVHPDDGGDSIVEVADTGMAISSFGEDSDGELFLVDFGGAVYRIGLE